MNFLRIDSTVSITPNYLESVRSSLEIERLDQTDLNLEKSKYVDLPPDTQREYNIFYKANFNCHTVGYPIYVILKHRLKINNNNVVANIAAGLKELARSDELDNIHGYLIGVIIPRVCLNHHVNVEGMMDAALHDMELEITVDLHKKIDELCEKAIASAKSSSIGATLLAHKASRTKSKK